MAERRRRQAGAASKVADRHEVVLGATDEASAAKGREIALGLAAAGLSEVRVETMRLKPAVVCGLGVNPADP